MLIALVELLWPTVAQARKPHLVFLTVYALQALTAQTPLTLAQSTSFTSKHHDTQN